MTKKIFTIFALVLFSFSIAQASEDPFHRPPSIKNVDMGELLSITCKPGPNAVTIQWFKDGVLIPGENNLVLQRSFTNYSDAGIYYAEVNYNTQCGMLRTNDVIVNIGTNPKLGVGSDNSVYISAPEPNPVSDHSIIKFTLPESSNAKLILLDMTGSLAATLFEGSANAGLNTVNISPAELNLSSGTYFLKLVTDKGNASQTLNILK